MKISLDTFCGKVYKVDMGYKQLVSFRVAPAIKEAIKRIADREQRTLSQVGERLLAEQLKKGRKS